MTDKQIMIDGVDVSGCEHYDEVCLGNHHYKWCKDNDNCYYKQLKRKEQECEELKERLNCNCFDPKNNNNRCISYNRIAEDYERDLKQLDQLKSEYEELRQFLAKEPLALQALQSGYADYKKRSEVFFEMINQYKQTLTEIKEIAEHCYDQADKENDGFWTILQKISECEV